MISRSCEVTSKSFWRITIVTNIEPIRSRNNDMKPPPRAGKRVLHFNWLIIFFNQRERDKENHYSLQTISFGWITLA